MQGCCRLVALVGTLKSRIPFYFKRTQMHGREYQHIANCMKYNKVMITISCRSLFLCERTEETAREKKKSNICHERHKQANGKKLHLSVFLSCERHYNFFLALCHGVLEDGDNIHMNLHMLHKTCQKTL